MNVQPGDLLLYRISGSSNWLDKAIGWGQRKIHQAPTTANYCHVAIMGPDAVHLYEAVWPKSHNTEFNMTTIQKNLVIEVYRVKDVTPKEIDLVMGYCFKNLGELYPVASILSFGFITLGHAPYCSELAWRAWMHAGRVLCDADGMITPDEIAASSQLERIP